MVSVLLLTRVCNPTFVFTNDGFANDQFAFWLMAVVSVVVSAVCDSPLVRAVGEGFVFNSFRTLASETDLAHVLTLFALKSLIGVNPFLLLSVNPEMLNCDPAGLNGKAKA